MRLPPNWLMNDQKLGELIRKRDQDIYRSYQNLEFSSISMPFTISKNEKWSLWVSTSLERDRFSNWSLLGQHTDRERLIRQMRSLKELFTDKAFIVKRGREKPDPLWHSGIQ